MTEEQEFRGGSGLLFEFLVRWLKACRLGRGCEAGLARRWCYIYAMIAAGPEFH